MILRQLFDQKSWTYTYLLADEDTREAVIIDPVVERIDRDMALLDELHLNLLYTMDTHVHADHVTASGELRERTGARSVVSASNDVVCVDRAVDDGDVIEFGKYKLEVLATPGHTGGCVSFVLRDGDTTMAFTGDALFIRGCGRTDFQAGDSRSLYRSVRGQLFSLPADTVVLPGHDYRGHTRSSIAEERAHNPRLKDGVTEDEFVEIMANLKLANPKLMDVAVPANLACGTGAQERPGKVAEITVQAVELADYYRIVDVREPDEFVGPLGHIEEAISVPLATLPQVAENWVRDKEYLLVCRSGARSARACETLTGMGFRDVTNLIGGTIAWNEIKS
ncbi:MAG: glyoxylase-like metal-dependent hydrolase (beta-lactamase superfamily II) [Bradymonadia bacterium]|jgi:glyoxylase-like metal-dependent hydrolase (beta-lactamase superfamily II)/rhodanese-related sulfurtransferase